MPAYILGFITKLFAAVQLLYNTLFTLDTSGLESCDILVVGTSLDHYDKHALAAPTDYA